mmetsp:Transcript_2964/g.8024  ORF Transcript_2964/g.8024 Transcript_2964/m.8024 type:complete len:152 (-) Transcript_2964:1151-1606(-)
MLRQVSLGVRRGIASYAGRRDGRTVAALQGMVRKVIKVEFDQGGSSRAPAGGGPRHARLSALSRFACSASNGDMGHMEPAEAFELLQTDGWKFVDCRTEEEFASGHVEDSVNIPVVFFSEAGMTPNTKFVEQLRAAVPDKSTKIIMVSAPA